MGKLVKTDNNGYLKDAETGIVINTRENEYQIYMAHRQKIKENTTLKQDIRDLRDEMSEIKQLLVQVLKVNG